ncbi:response regulator transcription factor [Candidatus Rariloculus sp.]|uniref:response regulator transcription factor n=1 Tax=Candidatus Rariloculus sp. TaxID=3101265 RepID=UPI003D0E74A4
MTTNHLLIVDDDAGLTEMLAEYLATEGITVRAARTGTQGLRDAQRNDYDLIILDVMLPGLSGFEVLSRLRESGSRTPVLMLTARGDDVDRIVGLEMGADDYLPKPFNPRELTARIKAVLRRSSADPADEPSDVEIGPLRAQYQRREAWLGDKPLNLTNAEFIILYRLMRSAGKVVSRETLTRAALGRQLLPDDRSLDTHVSNLRKKLSDATDTELRIRSIRGSGYVLAPPEN